MKNILSEALIPIMIGIVSLLASVLLIKNPEKVPFEKLMPKKMSIKGKKVSAVIGGALAVSAIFLILHFVLNAFTIVNVEMPVIVIILVSVLAQLFILFGMTDKQKLAVIFRRVFCSALVVMLCEVFVFNLKSFTAEPQQKTANWYTCQLEGQYSINNDALDITGNISVVCEDMPQFTRAILCDIDQEQLKDALPFHIKVYQKDSNFSQEFQQVQSKYTMAFDRDVDFKISPYKELKAVKLSIEEVSKPINFKSIIFASAIPFSFSLIRFLVILLAVSLIIAVKELKLYNVEYDRSKISHRLLTQLVTLICTFSAFMFYYPSDTVSYEYEPETPPISDIYALTMDAFIKSSPWLDINADPKLEEVEDVYCRDLRDATGAPYNWDTAYYKGHYYCYFGVAPVLMVYFPYYWITGKIPTRTYVNSILSTLAVFFFCQLLLSIAKLTVKKIDLLLLLLLMPGAVFATGIHIAMNYGNIYFLPISSGILWLSLCLWLGIEGYCSKKMLSRNIKLALSGAALALTVASRPGIALCSLILAPFFISILARKDSKLSSKILNASCFLVPVMIGAGLIMYYNNLRFESPFSFGAEYQLTVSNINANKLRLSSLPPTIYHYFFERPKMRETFPFFELAYTNFLNYTSYLYISTIVGAFSIPFLAFGAVLLPFTFVKKENGTKKASALSINVFTVMCLVLSVIIAWIDFCLGGALSHYACDFLSILSICLFSVLLRANSEKSKCRYILSVIASVITPVMMIMILLPQRDGNLIAACPNMLDILEDLLVFWQ